MIRLISFCIHHTEAAKRRRNSRLLLSYYSHAFIAYTVTSAVLRYDVN